MPDAPEVPEPNGQVSDAVADNWVDRFAPPWTRPFLRLSRADRPVGTWLLVLPCWWGVLLAGWAGEDFGLFDVWIILGCGIGAWLMRGAGCTWNDITDRKIDAQVARTRSRPIPSGQVSVKAALIWMGVQALIAFAVLLSFNQAAIWLGISSLGLVVIYPFAKRFTWWPQMFLGLAFNWGALLGWTAHSGRLEWPAVLLYAAGISWTLFYDTIYAYQDTEDDALIGVKSTARLFGDNPRRILRAFMVLTVLFLAAAIILALPDQANPLVTVLALGGPWGVGWHLTWQLSRLETDRPDTCLKLFRSNRDCGLIFVLFLAVSLML
ncbi:MAG: 4-hydroxybenzoate octaprenyltransferase [Rhodobacterales bacterium]|nr:MAG: 4-hydroxybenzoate octaprenyltransferase [Rhodobacterales bacterium]